MESDVSEVKNMTTLGPYSFRVFVDCAWTKLHMGKEKNATGRRPVKQVGHGRRKRPMAEEVEKTGKKVKKATHVGAPPLDDIINTASTKTGKAKVGSSTGA